MLVLRSTPIFLDNSLLIMILLTEGTVVIRSQKVQL